jgi:Cu(I)/Ag(I) efflux system membrane fusion protein
MHPTISKNHPGDCPICGMKLVKQAPGGGASKPSERTILYYRSPMDPKQTSPTPRKDQMGMEYVPVYSDEAGGESDVAGLATVNIDPSRQQLIGLKAVDVQRGAVGGAWRTVGRVVVDETRVKHINLKIPAYVERIFVDFVGKPVAKGEALFAIYSPELLVAQEEFLLALRTQQKLASSATMLQDGAVLLDAARRKLELWDVPPSEIQRVEQTGEPIKTLTFYSPIAGVVTKKDVVEGMKLDAGAMPYEIVDLSEVWVLADVYESELKHVAVGMPASLTLKAFPNRSFEGRASFIDPFLDPKTRTVKVRLVFPNPTGELKPEMFGEVILRGAPREGLHIPADAVIESGTKSVVFVSLGEGKFQPREVELGDSDGSNVEVLSGVAEGEGVVTRANFLIDSESRLRASLAALSPSPSAPSTGGVSGGRNDEPGSEPPVSSHAEHGGPIP